MKRCQKILVSVFCFIFQVEADMIFNSGLTKKQKIILCLSIVFISIAISVAFDFI